MMLEDDFKDFPALSVALELFDARGDTLLDGKPLDDAKDDISDVDKDEEEGKDDCPVPHRDGGWR